jgi:ornithine--oxo-acid transaminase
MEHGVLSKDTHQTVVRFAPPLTITAGELDDALTLAGRAFAALAKERVGMDA